MPVNTRPGEQAEHRRAYFAYRGRQRAHEHVDADVRAAAHAVGGAELGHPHEHVDAQLLSPAHVELDRIVLQVGHARSEAVHHRQEDDDRGRAHQERDEPFLQVVEDAQLNIGSSPIDSAIDARPLAAGPAGMQPRSAGREAQASASAARSRPTCRPPSIVVLADARLHLLVHRHQRRLPFVGPRPA